jgi:large subunit ribosomal protein L10
MPNAQVLSEKKAIVAALKDKLQNAAAGIFVDYSGTDVATDTAMRKEMREAGVDYSVVKNTLVRFAIDDIGFGALDPILNGNTALAVSDDVIAPAKLICKYADAENSTIKIKAGFVDGELVDLSTIKSLASIPALPVLQAQLLGTMLAPITGLAVVLKQIAEKNGAPAEASEEAAPAAEEAAPAAE